MEQTQRKFTNPVVLAAASSGSAGARGAAPTEEHAGEIPPPDSFPAPMKDRSPAAERQDMLTPDCRLDT